MQQYQEGQTATHPDGRRLRYTSGEWVPLTEDGRPSYTPRPELMAGAKEFSDGSIIAGRQVIRGAQTGVSPETRGRINLSLGPAVRAQDNLASAEAEGQPYNEDWGATIVDKIPDWGLLSPIARAWGGDDWQDYDQSVATIEASLLPIFSGLAVTESEAKRFIRANQPQLGDTPETLSAKARNRQSVLNSAARATNQTLPYPDIGVYGEAGYREGGLAPGTRQTEDRAGRTDEDLIAEGFRKGEDGAWRRDLTVDQMMAAGYSFDGQNWHPPGGPPAAGGGEAPPPADPQDDPFGPLGRNSAAARAFMRQIPLARTAAAGLGSLFTDHSFSELLDAGEALGEIDGRNHPVSTRLGAAGGVAATAATPIGASANVLRSAGLGAKVVNSMLTGAGVGALYGADTSRGSLLDRADNVLTGAAVGGGVGAVAPLATSAAVRVASPVVNALGDVARPVAKKVHNALGTRSPAILREMAEENALGRGATRFVGSTNINLDRLRNNRSVLEAAVNRPVTAADTLNNGQRGALRGIAMASDDARQLAEDFAVGRAEALPANLGTTTRSILNVGENRSPAAVQADLQSRRAALAQAEYREPYATTVELAPEVIQALSGGPGRAAVQRARAAAEAWQDDAAVAELDQLSAALTNGDTLPAMSAGSIDRIRQALAGRGEQLAQRPGTRAVGAGLQSRAGKVDQALDAVPGLAEARGTYRDISGQIRASEAGEAFLGARPDEVAAAMANATPEQQAAFRASAARAVENAAGTTGSAPGVANRLAIPGTPQRQMMDAALGPEDAARLADAARAERDLLRNAQRMSPGQGSPTAEKQFDIGRAGGAALDVVTGRPLSALQRFGDVFASRGFNAREAEAIISAMTDPARTDEVISLLARKMSRREARNLQRAMRYQMLNSSSQLATGS